MDAYKFGKVIRDGKVAVLYSPGYGAGWFTWNSKHKECVFDPEVVAMVEEGKTPSDDWCGKRYGEEFYSGGSSQLEIEWIDEGALFKIGEYDGNESVEYGNSIDWFVA